MNAISIVGYILSGIIMGSSCYYVWAKLLNLKYNIRTFKFWLSFIAYNLLTFVNYYFSGNYYKIIFTILLFIVNIRIFFEKDLKKSIITGIVTEILYFLAELIFSIIMLIILQDNVEYAINTYFGTVLTNLIICLIVIMLVNLKFSNQMYKKLLDVTSKLTDSNIILICSILMISFNIFAMVPYYKVDTITIVLVNTALIAVYSYIIYKYIEQRNRYIDISDKYSLSENSLKELQNNVNRLMAINHENKNQLVTIRGMVANNDKDVLDNIDAMIEKKIKDDKDLKVRTSVISNTMLGSLIYSKLLTMKENKINYNLIISKSINKSHIINLGTDLNVDICKIIGVYLDNAIEATANVKDKEINIEFYLKADNLYIVISNTFDGHIDISSINDYGYTTKEEGHGFGLALVREIVKENDALDTETEIIDNKVFIQRLKIKM